MAHCSHLEAVDLVRAPQGQATRRLTGPEASDHVLRQRGRHVPDLHHFAAPVGRRGVPKGEGIHGHVAERGVLPLDDLGRYARAPCSPKDGPPKGWKAKARRSGAWPAAAWAGSRSWAPAAPSAWCRARTSHSTLATARPCDTERRACHVLGRDLEGVLLGWPRHQCGFAKVP